MAISRERLNQGISYEQFLDAMSRNRDRVEANERNAVLSQEDLAAFRALDQPIEVMALVEDWCGDVVANLPILARIAKDSGKLNLHLFVRDENPDLKQIYRNGPYESIPVFAFYDQDMNEIGRFVERPRSITELRAEKRRELYADHPEFGAPDAPVDQLPEDIRAELSRLNQEIRTQTASHGAPATVREIRQIVERAATKR